MENTDPNQGQNPQNPFKAPNDSRPNASDSFEASAMPNSPKFAKDGTVTRRAISSWYHAVSIARKLKRDDEGRSRRRSQGLRCITGRAPFSSKKLKELGQAQRYNLSFGYMGGAVNRAKTPYNQLGKKEEFLGNIRCDLPVEKRQIISEEFVKIIKEWGNWPRNYSAIVREVVQYGYTAGAVFLDPDDPFFEVARQGEALVPDRTPNSVKLTDVFVYDREYLIHELYDKIRGAQPDEEGLWGPWRIKNVQTALEKARPQSTQSRSTFDGSWEKFEQDLRANSLWYSYSDGSKVVKCSHVFCREASGRVSLWIVLNDVLGQEGPTQDSEPAPNSDGSVGQELYYFYEQFASMEEVMVYFSLEDADGQWHGPQGLCQKLFNTHQTIDRFRCQLFDQASSAGCVIVQPKDQKAMAALQMSVFGQFMALSHAVEINATKMPPIDENAFRLDALLLQTGVERAGDVVPNAPGINDAEKTATQSNLDQGEKMQVTETNLEEFSISLDKVLDQMIRRLMKPGSQNEWAMKFQQRCLARQVTPEDFLHVESTTVFSDVSAVMGKTTQVMNYMLQTYRGDPDVAQIQLKKRHISLLLDPESADELVPGDVTQINTLEAQRKQIIELSAMETGNDIQVSPEDFHGPEVEVVINWLTQQVQGMAQGKIPNPAVMQAMITHGESHIAMWKKVKGTNPGEIQAADQKIKQLAAQYKQAVDMIQKVAVEHAQPMPGEPAQPQPELQAA